jgi:UDP-N-acetylmuramoyl-tripeptide--D-alanyl-D-alanine ligase
VLNAAAAAAMALAAGLELEHVAQALSEARTLSRWRMEVHERPDGVTVVNDAYNANPDSMHAALEALHAIGHGPDGPRRTWAVLGEMLELGELSRTEHQGVGRWAAESGTDRLVVVGPGAAPIADGAASTPGARTEVTPVEDADAAYALLQSELVAGDVVLLKSSRDAGLRWLGDRLVGIEVPA